MKLIDKEKALTAIADEIRALHNEDTILIGESPEEIGLIKAFDVINHMPIVEEKPKGRWIRDFDGNEFHTYCSNCNEEFYEEDLWTVGDERLPNYYPNCGSYNGADMRGNEKKKKSTKPSS